MEFLDGDDLRTYIDNKHDFSNEDLILISIQLARAFVYLEGFNIIHRDLKPENIF